MSETAIFIVGVVVFTITVWGALVAGGLALGRIEIEQNEARRSNVDKKQLKKRFPFRLKY